MNFSKTEITTFIMKKSKEMGFSISGISESKKLIEEEEYLKKWIDLEYFGNMDWIKRNYEQRTNSEKIMPGSRSVITLGINYYNNISYSDNENTGKISRYALGYDYHKVVRKMLKELCTSIYNYAGGGEFKIFVDSGGILEKAFGNYGGIGWIGKNTLLINKNNGSWFFIGIIMTNLELEYNEKHEDLCGNCTLCIEACPTKALQEPYILNAEKCISYLTQYSTNPDNDKKMYGWIYGCDICQEVCPWNRTTINTGVKEFYQLIKHEIDISENINMNKEEFEKIYGNTPVKKAGYEQFIQNLKKNKLNNN